MRHVTKDNVEQILRSHFSKGRFNMRDIENVEGVGTNVIRYRLKQAHKTYTGVKESWYYEQFEKHYDPDYHVQSVNKLSIITQLSGGHVVKLLTKMGFKEAQPLPKKKVIESGKRPHRRKKKKTASEVEQAEQARLAKQHELNRLYFRHFIGGNEKLLYGN